MVPEMNDSRHAEPFDVTARLAEAKDFVSRSEALCSQHAALTAQIKELVEIWPSPEADALMARFKSAAEDIEAFRRSSREYRDFLDRLGVIVEAPPPLPKRRK